MKLLFSIILFAAFNITYAKPVKKLPLLSANENFKIEILDNAVDRNSPNDVIVVELRKDIDKNPKYKLWVYALPEKTFRLFSDKKKYFGYFKFKNHTVLVIGDDSAGYFFTKLNIFEQFKFLSYPPYDSKNNPPVSIEPVAYYYEYANNQFKFIVSGR